MRMFFVCLLGLVPSTVVAAPEQISTDVTLPISAVAAAASFNPDTLSAQGLRAVANVTNAISRDEICNTMAAAAQAHDIPVAFFTSLIWQESGFRAEAVSPVGAQGVAQFMPRVAEAMGLENPFDPLQALPMSARLLRTLFNQFGNFGLAAAAYNAGPLRVLNWLDRRKKATLPKETRDYVMRITGRDAEQWRGAKASVEFRAPPRTRCHVVASRAQQEDGAFKVVDMANIPLPRHRPGAVHEAPATAVAEAHQPRHAKTVTALRAVPASPPKSTAIAMVRVTVPKVKAMAAAKQPLKLLTVAQAKSTKAVQATPKAAKIIRVAKAN